MAEQRLIDAHDLKDLMYIACAGQDKEFIRMFESAIDECPTVDAVEVVRCKDCRKFMPYTNEYKAKVEHADGDCMMLIFGCADNQYCARRSDDFCSYGERRGEND